MIKRLAFWIILILPLLAFANHSKGLHLQLPNKTIEIKRSCIEESQICQVGPDAAAVMLKLRADFGEQLKKQTEKAIGQTALWVWNGRVVYAQTLSAPISHDLVVPNLTMLEAEYFKK